MKKLFFLSMMMMTFVFSAQAQNLEELKTKKADLEAQQKAKQRLTQYQRYMKEVKYCCWNWIDFLLIVDC